MMLAYVMASRVIIRQQNVSVDTDCYETLILLSKASVISAWALEESLIAEYSSLVSGLISSCYLHGDFRRLHQSTPVLSGLDIAGRER